MKRTVLFLVALLVFALMPAVAGAQTDEETAAIAAASFTASLTNEAVVSGRDACIRLHARFYHSRTLTVERDHAVVATYETDFEGHGFRFARIRITVRWGLQRDSRARFLSPAALTQMCVANILSPPGEGVEQADAAQQERGGRVNHRADLVDPRPHVAEPPHHTLLPDDSCQPRLIVHAIL